MLTLQTAAFLALAVGSVLRIRSAARNPRARFSWLASTVGALAILTLGSVIPLDVLDGAVGGTNIIYLVQNLLATVAFWLVLQAAVLKEDGELRRPQPRYWVLVMTLGAICLTFLFIDRGPTTPAFIHSHVDQVAAVLCASIYLAGISTLSIQLILAVRHRRVTAYWPFTIGGALIIVACVNEIVWLLLSHTNLTSTDAQAVGYALFDPLFYVGVILIVGGILSFTLRKWNRESRVTFAIRQLFRITKRAGIQTATVSDDPAGGETRLIEAYDLIINIHDEFLSGRLELSSHERRVVAQAEALVTRELSMPGSR